MTTALITGMAGFVGSHLADYLLEHTGWDIVGLNRWNDDLSNIKHLFPRINDNDRVSLVYADLTDASSVSDAVYRNPHGVDYVFHLAAQSYPLTSFTEPKATFDANITGTLNLLEAVRHYAPNAWVHNCSSSEVYGRVPKELVPIKEDCPFHPASPYAISKCAADLLGRHYAEAYGLNVITTRMFTHTGPRRGDVFAESTFAKQIAMCEASGARTVKAGNLESIRTIADVRDAVRAYHMALMVNPVRGVVYNIGGNYACTIGDVLDELMMLSPIGDGITVYEDPARLRPIDADLQVPDCSAFLSHTGWKPEIEFSQTMEDLLNYWRDKVKEPQLDR